MHYILSPKEFFLRSLQSKEHFDRTLLSICHLFHESKKIIANHLGTARIYREKKSVSMPKLIVPSCFEMSFLQKWCYLDCNKSILVSDKNNEYWITFNIVYFVGNGFSKYFLNGSNEHMRSSSYTESFQNDIPWKDYSILINNLVTRMSDTLYAKSSSPFFFVVVIDDSFVGIFAHSLVYYNFPVVLSLSIFASNVAVCLSLLYFKHATLSVRWISRPACSQSRSQAMPLWWT